MTADTPPPTDPKADLLAAINTVTTYAEDTALGTAILSAASELRAWWLSQREVRL